MGNCCGSEEQGDKESAGERDPRTMRKDVCCTDIIFLVLFIVFCIFLFFIAITSMVRGDPRRVVSGYDSSGNTCNNKNTKIEGLAHSGLDLTGKKYVFFMSVLHPKHTVQLCVERCPERTLVTKQDVVDYYRQTNISLCQYGTTPDVFKTFDRAGPCPSLPVFAGMPLMSRCVPKLSGIANQTQKDAVTNKFFENMNVNDILSKVLSDITNAWREIFAIAFICIVLASLMVILMRFFAFIIIWTIVILSSVGAVVGTILLWIGFGKYFNDDGSDPILVPVQGSVLKKRTLFLVAAIVASVLTVILLIVLIAMRRRISLVISLFKEAGKLITDIPLLLVQPFFTFVIYSLVTLYFIFILACISTMGTPTAVTEAQVTKVKFLKNAFEKQFWWINLIGWVWVTEFVLACQEFIVSGTVAIWYFSTDKNRLGFPILTSIWMLLCHHLGSIAFGSLVITVIKVIKYILTDIERNLKESESDTAKVCLKCCLCCMWCLENLLKFINRNAYTVIAIEGTNFCASARKAFLIIASNALRVAALNSVGDFVLFLGKVGVAVISAVIAYFWIANDTLSLFPNHRQHVLKESVRQGLHDLYYIGVPVAMVALFGFLIAHVFLSIYEMVVDALMICFCVDSDRNDGSEGREYFMSESLMEFVTDSSAKLESMDKKKSAESHAVKESTSLTSH